MTLFDIKKIKESVGKSAGGIRKTLSDAAEKLPEAAKSINIPEPMKDMVEKGQNMMDSLKAKGDELAAARKEKSDETKAAINAAMSDERGTQAVFSVRDSLRILYCLMLIDGAVALEEEAKFSEIGLSCDPDFNIYKKQLIDECYAAAQSESAQGVEFVSLETEDSEEYYDQIHNYVGNLIKEENFYRTEGVRAKELLWNLLATAYSEDDYSENEKRLIRFIADKSGVDRAILPEMERKLIALTEIEKEEELLKSTDWPRKAIEESAAELSKRKNSIMQEIDALVS